MKPEQILPYAKPWILIDDMQYEESAGWATSKKLVSSSDHYVRGHFPEQSIYPGVLLAEGMVQTIEAVLLHEKICMKLVEATSRFLRPAVPGDEVHFVVKICDRQADRWVCEGTGFVDEQQMIHSTMTFAK
ncbi:3-hydroxyacyl-ACP dehydratase FabZ family protein [Marinicrinis sediminis]|uniref:3-hydroxyacyl-ACP dehydratase FabZ family protein n=1 Tax=Marinicrinis sediminis TaxID=1652465 RepID=A0ABW5REB4_9BACL